MGLKIVTADDRLQNHSGIKIVLLGPSKIGKTSLLWTLDPETTLCVDMEAGMLSVQGWQGDSIECRKWEDARNLACFLGGPNPALRSDQPYSQAHYDYCVGIYGDPSILDKYKTFFVDSITVSGRLSFGWCQGQPQAYSEKTGKPDTRGAYGLHGREMISFLTQLQHIKGKNVVLVGILDEKTDDFNRTVYVPQIEGSKTSLELPGIVDEVISMVELKNDEGQPYRAFVCTRPNPWGYPAGDRSGRLQMIEKPHLGQLMEKISGPVKPINQRLDYAMPTTSDEEGE
jgi:hypothetical protein